MSNKNLIANLYNPHQQSPQALIDSFVVRLHTFQRVLRDIKEDDMRYPPQPLLIVGQRGMGKTTLLLRLGYEVEQDEELKDWLVPLVFTEELYGVTSLGRFWEKTAEYLEDKLPEFGGLVDEMDDAFAANPDTHEQRSFQLLSKRLQANEKKLLLFIDNFNDIIDKFSDKENLRLREVLQTSADLRIIAASAVTIESFYRYDKPFYEFFKTIHLEGLNKEETYDLLRKLGENYKEESVNHIIENQPGRVETLRRLSGGVIRSIVLLFEIFVDHENGNAFQDLERILDRVTPLYKHRMDDLSKQQQPIVDAIARSWDAISTKDIAAATRLESKKVSAQLKQLIKNQIIQLVETPTKNHLYRIKERFFNIWYLMRLGRRYDKQRVIWLTRFFEEWCDEEMLVKRVGKHISALEGGNFNSQAAYLLTEAFNQILGLPDELQHDLLTKTKTFLDEVGEKELSENLSKSDFVLREESAEYYSGKDFEATLARLLDIKNKKGEDFYHISYCYFKLREYDKAENSILEALQISAGKNINAYSQEIDNLFPNIPLARIITYVASYQRTLRKPDLSYIDELLKVILNGRKKEEFWYLRCVILNSIELIEGALFSIDKAILEEAKLDVFWILKVEILKKIKRFEDGLNTFYEALQSNSSELLIENLTDFFFLLLAKKEYPLLHKFFTSPETQSLHPKDRFKPVWYALMYYMQDEYPHEYLKMGPELKETVEEIIAKVEEMRRELENEEISRLAD